MKVKKYRWRKVTPQVLLEMKILKEGGISYKRIAELFKINSSTVLYHLSPREKKETLKRSKEYNKKMTKEQKKEKSKRSKQYQKEYIMDRYHNDKEFRERYKRSVRKSHKKMRDRRRELGLCTKCGGKIEYKSYKDCNKCREKARNSYHKCKR